MRAGACAVQQTLTSEAASVLKHSLSLARRRGHAQVTPLHVAATLLSSRTSLLRRACLKSQPHQTSHPLQCRALELCFNVALNRLPTTPGPHLHGQLSLSNALIAALKRAQAHQRRGCIEQQQQQQPLLAIKVELEQLIFSILDDPSVSRVMREAGFSSTAVKNNLEDSSASPVFQCYNSSGGIYSVPSSPPSETHRDHFINPTSFWHNHFLAYSNSEQSPLFFSSQKKVLSHPFPDLASLKEDIKLVLEVFLRKKRNNTVIISDSVTISESLVAELMTRVERGDVPREMKSAQFIKFQFSSVPLKFMKREEVEHYLSDLKRKVHSLALGGGGVIIYMGDLKWAVDTGVGEKEGGLSNSNVSGYFPVDHLVSEIGKLLFDYRKSSTKVWLMATTNYQTYMRCQLKQPSLEIQWSLQAVAVPSGGLGLSLNATSVYDSRIAFSQNPSQMIERELFTGKEDQEVLNFCAECTANFEKEAALFKANHQKPSSLYIKPCNAKDMDKASTQLPFWLQSPNTEAHQKDELNELKRKWNKLCHSRHQGRNNQTQMNSSVLSDHSLTVKNNSSIPAYSWGSNQISSFPALNSISFANTPLKPNQTADGLPKFRRQQSCHIEFSFSNGNHKHYQPSEPNLDSLKKSDKEVKITLALGTSEFSNAQNLAFRHEDICKLLQENVPWQSRIISSLVETLITSVEEKKDYWILMQGNDSIGKKRLARAIAESLFGTDDLLFCVNTKKSASAEEIERVIRNNEKPVILVENIESADSKFARVLAAALDARERISSQTIFILTKGENETASFVDAEKNLSSVIQMKLQVGDSTKGNPDHKRKAEWDFTNKKKNPRIVKEEAASIDHGSIKKEFTRQLKSNTLDLNLKADEDYEAEARQGELSYPLLLLDKVENCFVFDQDSATDGRIRELFLSKIKKSFGELFGSENLDSLTVDEMVLEEIKLGSRSFLSSLFDKWLKDIFQKSLKSVNFGGKRGIEIRLCLGGKEEECSLEDGFMGSRLPKRIQVSNLD